jgi:epoxyqueuosine reductase QueG
MYLTPAGRPPTVAVTPMGECSRCRASQPTSALDTHELYGADLCARCLALLD